MEETLLQRGRSSSWMPPYKSRAPKHYSSGTGRLLHADVLAELDELLIGLRISRRTAPTSSARDEARSAQYDATGLPSQRIGRVLVYIEEHLDEALSVNRLAEEAAMTRYHFSRVFRREIGQSPWSFVREARISRAKSLLEEGSTPAEAAAESGFCDQAHLTNAMRRSEGITPAKYRREQEESTNLQD